MTVEILLNELHKVRKNGDGKWMACCPAHDDKSPSLSIKESAEGTILVHCFAGCEPSEILAMVGLGMADLFPQTDQHSFNNRPPSWDPVKRETRGESELIKIKIRYLTADAMIDGGHRFTQDEKNQLMEDRSYLKRVGELP